MNPTGLYDPYVEIWGSCGSRVFADEGPIRRKWGSGAATERGMRLFGDTVDQRRETRDVRETESNRLSPNLGSVRESHGATHASEKVRDRDTRCTGRERFTHVASRYTTVCRRYHKVDLLYDPASSCHYMYLSCNTCVPGPR